jgi:hypothetical protein
MSDFKFDPNSTKNEGRWRLRDPKTLTNYRRYKFLKGLPYIRGISFVIGDSDCEKGLVQAVRFDLSLFSEDRAAEWWDRYKILFTKIWSQENWDKEVI